MQIGIWGDSITYGECDSKGLGWVGRIRNSFPVDNYIGVYNRGISGDTTIGLLKRFEKEAESIRPNIIIFAIGINDSKFPIGSKENKVPFDDFKKNIQTLIDQAKKYTSNIFLLGLTKVDESLVNSPSDDNFTNKQIELYNSFLQNFAENENILWIDMFDVITNEDLYDGLHPNASGYEKMSRIIIDKIK